MSRATYHEHHDDTSDEGVVLVPKLKAGELSQGSGSRVKTSSSSASSSPSRQKEVVEWPVSIQVHSPSQFERSAISTKRSKVLAYDRPQAEFEMRMPTSDWDGDDLPWSASLSRQHTRTELNEDPIRPEDEAGKLRQAALGLDATLRSLKRNGTNEQLAAPHHLLSEQPPNPIVAALEAQRQPDMNNQNSSQASSFFHPTALAENDATAKWHVGPAVVMRELTLKRFIIYTCSTLVLVLFGLLCRYIWPSVFLYENQVSDWMLFAGFVIGFHYIALLLDYGFFFCMEKVLPSKVWQAYFYISAFHGSLALIIWVAVVWASFPSFISFSNSIFLTNARRTFTSVLLLAIFFPFRQIVFKYLVHQYFEKSFSKQVFDLTYQLRAIRYLSLISDKPVGPVLPEQTPQAFWRFTKKIMMGDFRMAGSGGYLKNIYSSIQLRNVTANLFHRLDQDAKGYLTAADFATRFLSSDLAKSFAIFDSNSNGEVTEEELVVTVEKIYNEFLFLSAGLRDYDKASNVLKSVARIIYWMIMVVIILLVFNVDVYTTLMPFWTLIVPASFAFGTSAKNFVEGLVFIFSVQPYDIGDRVKIEEDEVMYVHKINVLSTTFRNGKNEIIYIPNSTLAVKKIRNHGRSLHCVFDLNLELSYLTSEEQLLEIKSRFKSYVDSHSLEWKPTVDMTVNKILPSSRVEIGFYLNHLQSWQDSGKLSAARTGFLLYAVQVLKDLNIDFRLPPQQIVLSDRLDDGLVNKLSAKNTQIS